MLLLRTPSLVPPSLIKVILDCLHQQYGIHPDAEISLEADPGTFDEQRLQEYMALGVNRASIGVQAFQQELLETCGRAHDLKEVYSAIEAAHSSGIRCWSLDLISGLPNLTTGMWEHSLREAIKAAPSHISVYDLQVEESTPFARWFKPGASPLPQDDDAATMYAMASNMLRQSGYEHYEVSNYARPGFRCQHNQVYWLGKPYYAFGLGAASYVEGVRFSRPMKMKEYVAWVERLQQTPGLAHTSTGMAPESKEERMLDTVMLRLRMADGLDMLGFGDTYGPEAATAVRVSLERHAQQGLVQTLDAGARLRLVDPDGFLLSNDIISDVFAALSGGLAGAG